MGKIDSLRALLTRHYLNVYGSEFQTKEPLTVSGIEADVYWFSDDGFRAGQATIFNTITLNENYLSELPDFVTEYVFLHEVGHTRAPFPLRILFFALAIILGLFALASVVSAPLLPLSVFLDTGSISSTFTAVGSSILLLFVGVLPFALLVRFDESHAELFALNYIGEESYLSAKEAMRQSPSGSVLGRTLNFVLYPSPGFIIWLSRKL